MADNKDIQVVVNDVTKTNDVDDDTIPGRSESYRVAFDHSSPTTDVIVSVPADFAESKYSTPKGSAPPSRSGSNTSNDSKRRDGPSRRKGSHIPAVDRASVSLTWQNLRYTVPVKQKVDGKKVVVNKVILEGVTGACKPGEMLCVMGTSGSGKTSFLNVLAGRHDLNTTVTGKVLCNGMPRGNAFKRTIAFVSQDDLLFGNLTVTEMLRFTAVLRLPRELPHDAKLERAEEVIDQLGLHDCRDTRIGSEERRGISGGERKRTSIAVELITNPRILFLDEPTSGLDAYTAVHVMQTIKQLTLSGRIVMSAIHQPRNKIYELFDKTLVFARGGVTVFMGPSKECVKFLESVGHACPPHENLADHLLDVATIDTRTVELFEQTSSTVDTLAKAYSESEYARTAESEVAECAAGCSESGEKGLVSGRTWNLTWGEEYMILLQRAWKLVTREAKTTKVALGQAIFMGILVGIVFWDLQMDQTGISDRRGVLFFMVLGNAFPALSQCLLLFHAEKKVFNRERIAGAYRVSSYFLAKSTTDLPVTVAPVFVYLLIAYWMVGLTNTAEAFFKTLLMLIMVVICAQSYGSLISAATSSIQVAQAIGPLSMILMILFGGFYLAVDSIPVWLTWIEVFSFLQYAFVGLIHVQFKDQEFVCDDPTYCLPTGEAVLKQMDIDGKNRGYWQEFGKVTALAVGFRFLAYLALRFMHRKKLHFD